MDVATAEQSVRRPRFRRASEPPAFRLTDDDVEIVRQIARYRFLRSTHVAALVGRSLDRTNDRLMRLFHAGYIDRPRAQLDRFPSCGSAPYIYALADRGVRLLREWDGAEFRNPEWSRKNREAGRPFIEHQIEIVDFQVALQRAVAQRSDVRLIHAEEMNAATSRRPMRDTRQPFALRARIGDRGLVREISVVPDLVFGLQFADGECRNFMVEIDRGTMPITRSDIAQTSVSRKMRVYIAAHAAKQHHRQFGWRNFRVLMITSDRERMASMVDAAERLRSRSSIGASLFRFATYRDLSEPNPLACRWFDGSGSRDASLIKKSEAQPAPEPASGLPAHLNCWSLVEL